MIPLKNGRGLTNGPDHVNGSDLTSFEWKMVDHHQLEGLKKLGKIKRLIRWLMR